MAQPNAAIPIGSTVLVSGATGYIASQTIKNLLERGYKVRGTVRDLEKASWLNTEVFTTYAKSGQFELVKVADIGTQGAFDEVIKGVAGFIHIATIATWSSVPDEVIPPTVQAAVNALDAAYKEDSVKRFVFTSSVVAQSMILPDTEFHVTKDSWNDKAAAIAYAPPPYDSSRAGAVYQQSKVEAEKAVWKFVEEKQPKFSVNVVNPALVLGEVLNRRQWNLTPSNVKYLWEGHPEKMPQSKATIHVAALLDSETKNARLPTWSQAFDWNQVLGIFRKLKPDGKFLEHLEGQGKFLGTVDETQSKALLKKWTGQDNWISLETGITEMVEQIEKMNV